MTHIYNTWLSDLFVKQILGTQPWKDLLGILHRFGWFYDANPLQVTILKMASVWIQTEISKTLWHENVSVNTMLPTPIHVDKYNMLLVDLHTGYVRGTEKNPNIVHYF